MQQMINVEDIKLASGSQYDVVGRVFFAGGRVFRAITSEGADEMLAFLQSPLFAELQRRRWIPKTWINKDIKLPGFVFCLEHEKMFASQAKEWSFEMMKEAALFTIRLDALCKEYGYIIKDALFDNICFDQGKPCWVDIGSFRRREPLGQPFYKYYFVWNIYVYLSMFAQGSDMMARSLLNGWFLEKPFVLPDKSPEHTYTAWQYAKDLISFDYYIRMKWPHITLPITKERDLYVKRLNAFARILLHKNKDWDFIKARLVYKDVEESDIQQLDAHYQNGISCYQEEDGEILKELSTFVRKHEIQIEKVLLFGNFPPSDIAAYLDGERIIASNDAIFIDKAFREIEQYAYNIHPVCTNFFAPQIDSSTKSLLRSDMLIVGNMLSEWEIPTTPKEFKQPPRAFISIIERVSEYTSKYMIVPTLSAEKQDIISIYFDKVSNISENYTLYKKRIK